MVRSDTDRLHPNSDPEEEGPVATLAIEPLPLLVRFSRPYSSREKEPDPIFDDATFRREIGSKFNGLVFQNEGEVEVGLSRFPQHLPNMPPLASWSELLVVFGGPAAVGAFLKYAFDKVVEWKRISSANSVTIELNDVSISVARAADLNKAIEAAQRLSKSQKPKRRQSHTATKKGPRK